jgi:hypothetical protein
MVGLMLFWFYPFGFSGPIAVFTRSPRCVVAGNSLNLRHSKPVSAGPQIETSGLADSA